MPLWARHTLGTESALGDGLPPSLSSSIRRGRQPVQAGPGGLRVLFFRASAHQPRWARSCRVERTPDERSTFSAGRVGRSRQQALL